MNWRVTLPALLLLLLMGLVACVPSPDGQAEPSALPSGSPTTAPADRITPSQPSPDDQAPADQDQQATEESNQILVAPTLAPTATPGAIYSVVEQVVEATNLGETQFIGLYAADWINLAISLLLVFLTITLIARLIFTILRKIALRTATPYDEIYLDSIRSPLRWLLVVIILYIATMRLQFISPAFKQWLGQIYYVLIVGLIVIGLWKLVDIFTLWYQEKVKDQGERDGKEAVLLWRACHAHLAAPDRPDRDPGSFRL